MCIGNASSWSELGPVGGWEKGGGGGGGDVGEAKRGSVTHGLVVAVHQGLEQMSYQFADQYKNACTCEGSG